MDNIFKAYDVRGVYPNELNEEIMEKIGGAFVKFLGASSILVGCDMRISTPQLVEAFKRGALKGGAQVTDLGQISTDCLYFASGKYNLAGAMITASHNPKEWNGVKFCRAGAEPIGADSGLREIESLVIKQSILSEFRDHCQSFIDKTKLRSLKVVIDAGNGMAGKMVPAVFQGLPIQVVPLFFELDGNFPNHQPSPIEKKNNLALIERVKVERADLGLAFDGDADRVFFVDEHGEMVDSSFITAMIAKKMLEKFPREKIIYSVTVSNAVPELVAKMGGSAILTKVGHSFIKQVMKETNAIFGGEHSGHYYFRDNFRADSGIIAALIVLEMLSEASAQDGRNGKPFSELVGEFQTYHKIEETNFQVADVKVVLENFKKQFGANLAQDFDGMSFEFKDAFGKIEWWFNVRASNTEPVLRLNLEAKTRELMAEKFGEIASIIKYPR
ncbi:MAG: phosphomannomutase/phosphoglucomutase [Candidatus Falkowbacteria bacterium]